MRAASWSGRHWRRLAPPPAPASRAPAPRLAPAALKAPCDDDAEITDERFYYLLFDTLAHHLFSEMLPRRVHR
ncbi:hypothetical protein JYU34_008438 [Plutella xylostella]|uniref:Uncharacterized protein n=1 Tax=Plutella xylostella TaxID=51655 RepID=A0ABQ7QKX5_PLUXY|nr:hypothetical protein JYU34_008438 [Plutella xylostella]